MSFSGPRSVRVFTKITVIPKGVDMHRIRLACIPRSSRRGVYRLRNRSKSTRSRRSSFQLREIKKNQSFSHNNSMHPCSVPCGASPFSIVESEIKLPAIPENCFRMECQTVRSTRSSVGLNRLFNTTTVAPKALNRSSAPCIRYRSGHQNPVFPPMSIGRR